MEAKLEKATNKLKGYYKVSNNCREQGFMLTIMDKNYENDLPLHKIHDMVKEVFDATLQTVI